MSTRSIVHGAMAAFAVMGTLVTGCGLVSGATASTVTGAIDQQSFAAPVSKILVRGGETDVTISVNRAGKFNAELERGASYQLLVLQGKSLVPIVLRRGAGRLDTTVFVKSGGAKVDLGQVTYWQNGAVAPPAAIGQAGMECNDGDAEVNDDGADCENGIDATTGEACDGGPDANPDGGEVEDSDISESDEMGLPDNDLPDSIGCYGDGEDDGEEADD